MSSSSTTPTYSRLFTNVVYVTVGVIIGLGIFLAFLLFPTRNSVQLSTSATHPVDLESISVKRLENTNDIVELTGHTTEFARDVALFEIIVDSDFDHLLSLLERSQRISYPSRRRNTQELILRRLATMNPVLALRQIENLDHYDQSVLVSAVFREWAYSDHHAAIAHAKTLTPSNRSVALATILKVKDDLPGDQRRALGLELGTEQQVDALLRQEEVEDAMHDPKRAWDLVTYDDVGDVLQFGELFRLAQIGIETEGLHFVTQVLESVTEWDYPELSFWILREVVRRSTYDNPRETLRAAVKLTGATAEIVRETALKTWAASDPIVALQVASSFEPAEQRRRLQDIVLGEWADTDPQGILDQIDVIPKTLRSDVRERVVEVLSRLPLVEAMEYFETAENRLFTPSLMRHFLTFRLNREGEQTLAWVLSEPAIEDMRSALLRHALAFLARQNPERAIAILSQYPQYDKDWMGHSTREMIVDIVAREIDTERAIDLVADLNEKYQYELYLRVCQNMIRQGQFGRAFEVVSEVPEPAQREFEYQLISTWGQYHLDELFNKLTDFPAHLQSRVARTVIIRNHRQDILNDQEIARTRSFLNDDDKHFLASLQLESF